jgi:hypothetical protein
VQRAIFTGMPPKVGIQLRKEVNLLDLSDLFPDEIKDQA